MTIKPGASGADRLNSGDARDACRPFSVLGPRQPLCMRILHVIPQFPYFGGRTVVGGHANCLFTLAGRQAAEGNQVTILTYVHGRAGEIPVADRLAAVSLYAHARPGSVSFGLRFLRDAPRWARREGRDADVVHVHSGFADYLLVTASLARALRRPTIHTMYCPIPDRGGRLNRPPLKQFLRHAAGRATALTAMSRNVAGSMERFGLGRRRPIEVIPPPIDLDRYRPAPGPVALRHELGLGDDEIAILFVGNAKPQKNLSGVLDAFARVHQRHGNARLVVTTELKQSSPDESIARLRGRMEALGIARHIVQLGIVENMPELMRACDVLVAPFMDSFGPSDYFMAALEAMASGKPVVVSAVGGMAEVVSEDCGRLIDPRSSEQIADALEVFLADPLLRERAGRAARGVCERLFDPAEAVRRFGILYNLDPQKRSAGA